MKILLLLSQTHPTWSHQTFVSSLVSTSWPPAVKCLLAQRWRTIGQTVSSLVSSVNSALDTCRACAGTTETAMVARSSSSAKTVLFSPATSKRTLPWVYCTAYTSNTHVQTLARIWCFFLCLISLRNTFNLHVEAGHNNNAPEDLPKDLRCPLCLYHTKHRSNMIDHIVLHRGNGYSSPRLFLVQDVP